MSQLVKLKNESVTVIADHIDAFRNKAGCSYTQDAAGRHYEQLRKFISDKDLHGVRIGWAHYRNGEGAGELYDECKKLKQKYQ
jgi:hypothetical protein